MKYSNISRYYTFITLLFICFLCYATKLAYSADDAHVVVASTKVFAEDGRIGKAPLIVITLQILNGNYVYSHDEIHGKPLSITTTVMHGINPEIFYPKSIEQPDLFDQNTKIKAITGNAYAFIRLRHAGEQPIPSSMRINIKGLACSDKRCEPFDMDFSIVIPPVTSLSDISTDEEIEKALSDAIPSHHISGLIPVEIIDEEKAELGEFKFTPRYFHSKAEPDSLIIALIFGIIAGLVLNVMPCVLPVLALKMASLSQISKMSKKEFIKYNFAFSSGIIAWFAFFATIFATADVLWGAVFREPVAIGILAVIIIILALSLFGVINLPIPGLRVGLDNGTIKDSFISGFLVTILATPCSGPLLGGVIAWSITRSPFEQFLVFTAVGIGMSLPFLIMAIFPSIINLMPRPGRWCETVSKITGVLLLATAGYLISLLPWSFSPHTPFDYNAFRSQLGKENILAQFTADWCPTCKVLERTVLNRKTLAQYQAKYGLKIIKVDLTRENKVRENLLKSLGSVSIPLTAIFPSGEQSKQPLVLRDVYTGDTLMEALKSVFGY